MLSFFIIPTIFSLSCHLVVNKKLVVVFHDSNHLLVSFMSFNGKEENDDGGSKGKREPKLEKSRSRILRKGLIIVTKNPVVEDSTRGPRT